MDICCGICPFPFRARWHALRSQVERQVSQQLLHNTLPRCIADQLMHRLRANPKVQLEQLSLAYAHPSATVMFAGVRRLPLCPAFQT